MKKIYLFFTMILVLLLIVSHNVMGHVPRGAEENDSLEHAMHINEPKKSWAIYHELENKEQVRYYELHLEKGDRFYVSILTPEDGDFSPGLVIMGPGIDSNDSAPSNLEVPEDVDVLVLEGEKEEEAEYEPFTPASNYFLTSYDENVNESGDYYIAVFENLTGGKYILAVGFQESFTIIEWLRVPVDQINIYLWTGHSPLMIAAPFLIWILVGIWILIRYFKVTTINVWLAAVGGLIYLGSGTLIAIEMAISLTRASANASVIVTLIFILIPVLLGAVILMKIMKNEDVLDRQNRIVFAIYGFLGLIFWSGVIIGPTLILISSVLPILYVPQMKPEVEKKQEE
jgi:hypothetical protein